MESAYVYQRLSDAQLQIRLLHLHGSDDKDSPLTGSIETYDVPTNEPLTEPRFEALSYTWGTTTSEKGLIVNGKTLLVTENLASFLRVRRQQQQQELVFWIDAICINQQDMEEKSQQIPLMGFIYVLAFQATIWLGPSSSDSDEGMEWLDQLGRDSPYAKMPLLSSKSLRAVQGILLRPWWTRIWIIQEIVAGGFHARMHRMTLLCGEQTIAWMNLVIAAARMRAYQDDQRQLFPNIDRILELDALRDSPLGLRLAGPHCVYIDRSLYSPMVMLARCRRYDSTNPRDKVYAIYNLIAETIPGLDKPDYETSVENVYTNLAVSQYKQGDLELLRQCGSSSLQAPSWVPDWSVKLRCRPLPTGPGLYFDVPWWSDPPADSAPQIQEYGPYRDALAEPNRGRIVPGYSFRGYQFHGYNVFDKQWAFEKAHRLERLRLSLQERNLTFEFEALSPSTDTSSRPSTDELAEYHEIRSALVRDVYDCVSKRILEDKEGAHPLRRGELVTEREQKTKLLKSLDDPSSPYEAGGEVPFEVVFDRRLCEANVSGILWDTVDTVHTEPFPDNIEETWQNATLFMMAVGLCKALATTHQAARKRYPDIRSRMMAFWSTSFAGQLLLVDQSIIQVFGGDNMMDYMNWLPEIDSTWSSGTPPWTPTTSGLIHLQQIIQHQRDALALTHLKTFALTDWLSGPSSEEGESDGDRSHENSDIQDLFPVGQGANYEEELGRLASLWHQQPYDLYHRPFRLLNVVPDPFWKDRKEHDDLARRKTLAHKATPILSPGPGIQPGSAEYKEFEKIAQRVCESEKNDISLDPPGILEAGMEQYALGRRFFVTEKGYFGLGPENIRPGDRVAVLFGLSVPLALREHEENGCRSRTVLGETYVHDIMDGEVVDQWRVHLVEDENIVLR
ncbi:hypothetical protein PRZ48_010687 [Zasmidium cellare]|uniref:Heterokaryon incompatibility domain-containing protein n=1 Tax=Zasmidium cellare TaxID=395010 RepID=A0ABR0E9D8_ZASCE|nr:hypothetical protein PRZ48_010687 [Zasmidium cellare]